MSDKPFKWLSRRYNKLRKPNIADEVESVFPSIEKFGEDLTPNMRALRLAMTACDLLLSMGVSANSAVTRVLDITETYCMRPVHIDINANLVMLSQLRGIDKEPLTLIRPVTIRDINYMTLQSVQNLIHDIHLGNVYLDEAEERLEKIIQQPRKFPTWITVLGNGILVGGISMMFTSSWQVILTTIVIGCLVERTLVYLGSRGIPGFFRQIAAALLVTLLAAILSSLGNYGIDFFYDADPTIIVVGGIILLVSGLSIVGSIQDAIEEYLLTANARMTKVFLATIGIIVGIVIGLYVARKVGLGIAVASDPLLGNTLNMQILGAIVATIGYAISTNTNIRAIGWVGIIGGISLAVVYTSINWFDISIVPASGIAATIVGLSSAMMSRLWHTPSSGIITAGIIPLVPGLLLFNGLMQLMNYPPGNPLFFKGLGTLFAVGAVGLAIAAGASLGSMVARPFRQKMTPKRNIAPFASLLKTQFKSTNRPNLARFVLRRGRAHKNPEKNMKVDDPEAVTVDKEILKDSEYKGDNSDNPEDENYYSS